MARTEDPTARAQRLIPLATVGALAFATALAFGRVFAGRGPTLRLIAAGLLAVAIGWATGRRGLLAATLASLAGLALALTWFVFPQTAWYGLPSVRTLRAIGRSLEFVGQQTRTQVSPSPPLPPLMLAALTAVWAASSSAYTLAVRAGSPILAALPPVALVAFADIVLEDGVRPVYAATFLLAALAVVFTDGLRRIRQWGPVWSGTYRDHTIRSVAGRGVRRVTIVALGAALLVPGLLPGFRSDPLLSMTGGSGGIGEDPFASVYASLNRGEPVEQFRVTTDGPGSYWRLLALDEFDGSDWRMSDPGLGEAVSYPTPATLPVAVPEGTEQLQQEIEIVGYRDRWVPMAYPAATVSIDAAALEYEEDLGAARVPDPLVAGQRYQVSSYRVLPTPQQLDREVFDPTAEDGDLTFLPDSLPERVGEIAREWTAGQQTPYREILAIQERLKDTAVFQYDKSIEPDPAVDGILRFLTETRTGFCQQFATTMTVLVRSLGYPARVGYGYRQGDDLGGTFIVDSHDLHTWVEVKFPTYGWLVFDPTPGLGSSPLFEQGTYLDSTAAAKIAPPELRSDESNEQIDVSPATGDLPPKLAGFERVSRTSTGGLTDVPPFVPRAGSGPVQEEPGYAIPYGLLLTIVLVALGAVLVLVPIVKAVWRYRALHRRREPRDAVLAAYRVFDGEAADLGLGRRGGETLAEYRDRIGAAVRFSDGHLGTLTAAAMRAAYSPDAPEPGDAQEAARAAHTAIRDMRRSTGLVRRVTGIYRPGM